MISGRFQFAMYKMYIVRHHLLFLKGKIQMNSNIKSHHRQATESMDNSISKGKWGKARQSKPIARGSKAQSSNPSAQKPKCPKANQRHGKYSIKGKATGNETRQVLSISPKVLLS